VKHLKDEVILFQSQNAGDRELWKQRNTVSGSSAMEKHHRVPPRIYNAIRFPIDRALQRELSTPDHAGRLPTGALKSGLTKASRGKTRAALKRYAERQLYGYLNRFGVKCDYLGTGQEYDKSELSITERDLLDEQRDKKLTLKRKRTREEIADSVRKSKRARKGRSTQREPNGRSTQDVLNKFVKDSATSMHATDASEIVELTRVRYANSSVKRFYRFAIPLRWLTPEEEAEVELRMHPSSRAQCRLFMTVAMAVFHPDRLLHLPFYLNNFTGDDVTSSIVVALKKEFPLWRTAMFAKDDPLVFAASGEFSDPNFAKIREEIIDAFGGVTPVDVLENGDIVEISDPYGEEPETTDRYVLGNIVDNEPYRKLLEQEIAPWIKRRASVVKAEEGVQPAGVNSNPAPVVPSMMYRRLLELVGPQNAERTMTQVLLVQPPISLLHGVLFDQSSSKLLLNMVRTVHRHTHGSEEEINELIQCAEDEDEEKQDVINAVGKLDDLDSDQPGRVTSADVEAGLASLTAAHEEIRIMYDHSFVSWRVLPPSNPKKLFLAGEKTERVWNGD